MNTLARLAELERQYDGPVPAPVMQAATLGSALRVALLAAEATVTFYESMVKGQVATIVKRSEDGTLRDYMVADLRHYRKHLAHWQARAAWLAAAEAERSAG